MAVEKGKVLKLEGDKAIVAFERCARCDKCRICTLARDGLHVTRTVPNTLNANVGDEVEVEMRARAATVSALIYLVPLALTAIGAGIGTIFSNGASAILAAAGLIVGLAIALPIDLAVFRKRLRPSMRSFAPSDEQPQGQNDKERTL